MSKAFYGSAWAPGQVLYGSRGPAMADAFEVRVESYDCDLRRYIVKRVDDGYTYVLPEGLVRDQFQKTAGLAVRRWRAEASK